jgi:hypothetical protein
MSKAPIICFGQQPCGFFPKRYLYAKIQTARRLQAEMGGEIVYFYHDSDHDPRETYTILRQRSSDVPFRVNFAFANRIQKKYAPMYVKKVPADWHEKTALQLRHYVDPRWVEVFKSIPPSTVADFCLDMYGAMGLLEGVRVARSSDPAFRREACDIADFFVDVPYSGEIVRARFMDGALKLHAGGNVYETVPSTPFTKDQISPARDTRLRWMQSVIGCTHYIAGAGEQVYLRREDAPGVTFVNRDFIERSDEAYTEIPS